jgi:hypothetical protein
VLQLVGCAANIPSKLVDDIDHLLRLADLNETRAAGEAEGKVSRFYVTDSKSAERATRALRDGKRATISGTIGSETRTSTGMVRSVEQVSDASPRRWVITIIDAK